MVPALVPVVDHSSTGSDWPHFGIEVRIKEKCEGKTIVFCNVLHAMRRRQVAAAREAIQHVADIADERIRYWSDVDPLRFRFHL